MDVLIKHQEESVKDNSKEFLFSFGGTRTREMFSKKLGNKTLQLFSQINLYGVSGRIFDPIQIKKQFKIYGGPFTEEFVQNYESLIRKEDAEDTIIIEFLEYYDLYDEYVRQKKCLWMQSDPDCKIFHVLFVDELQRDLVIIDGMKYNIVYNFWMIITYGLHNLLEQHTLLKQHGLWSKFLTEGCYDPRILIYIEQFCDYYEMLEHPLGNTYIDYRFS